MACTRGGGDLRVVLFSFLLYSHLFFFLSSYILHSRVLPLFVEYIASDTSRPDLKEPFTVFVINQCFTLPFTNDCQSNHLS